MKRQFVYIRQRRVVIRFHIAPCRRTKLLHMILLPCVMRVLTRHSKQQKESVRRRGSSLRRKARQIALQGSIRMLLVYEDPTHGVWHITKYCPADVAFPDVNALVSIQTYVVYMLLIDHRLRNMIELGGRPGRGPVGLKAIRLTVAIDKRCRAKGASHHKGMP